MNRPKFESIFTQNSDYCEVSSDKPIADFIPNQALDLAELVSRFERGQRLNVHNNFAPGSNFEHITDEQAQFNMQHENFDDCPPINVHDVVDVHNLYQEHQDHKREFVERQKKKRESKQEKPSESPQDAPSTQD